MLPNVRLTVVMGFLFLFPAGLAAQSAVVKRNVNLRTGPSTSFSMVRLLLPGDELTLLERGKLPFSLSQTPHGSRT